MTGFTSYSTSSDALLTVVAWGLAAIAANAPTVFVLARVDRNGARKLGPYSVLGGVAALAMSLLVPQQMVLIVTIYAAVIVAAFLVFGRRSLGLAKTISLGALAVFLSFALSCIALWATFLPR